MPEFVARMRSGASLAISSTGLPSASSKRVGAVPPKVASCASNQSVERFALPPQVTLGAPTGATPSAATWSASDQPRVTTRSGSFVMVAVPKASFRVTGYAVGSAPGDPAPAADAPAGAGSELSPGPVVQPARTRAAATAARRAVRKRDTVTVSLSGTGPTPPLSALRETALGEAYLSKPHLTSVKPVPECH